MKKQHLMKFEKGLETSLSEYNNLPLTDDEKSKALGLVSKEIQIVTNEQKLNIEKENFRERIKLEKEKFSIEKERFENEKKAKDNDFILAVNRYNLEKEKLELEKKNRKEDTIFKFISLGLTIGVPAVTTLVSLLVYRKLAYVNLKLIYRDEGRPSNDFKDAVKSVQKMIK